MKCLATILWGLLLMSSGCGYSARFLTFQAATAQGYPLNDACRYDEVTLSPDAPVSIVLPGGQIIPMNQVSMASISNAGQDPAFSAANGSLFKYPRPLIQDNPIDKWNIAWIPPKTGFAAPAVRQYLLIFENGQLKTVQASCAGTAADGGWVPAFVHGSTGPAHGLPLTENELIDLFGPVKERYDHHGI